MIIKLSFAFFLVLLIPFQLSFGQSGWIRQYPPYIGGISDGFFLNSSTGWIVGDSGKINKTTNGGSNWVQMQIGTVNRLENISFSSPNVGFVSGLYGTIFKTTN